MESFQKSSMVTTYLGYWSIASNRELNSRIAVVSLSIV